MSLAATSWAWKTEVSNGPLLVLLALADCHNGITGLCCPSVAHIMAMTRLGRAAVFEALAVLKKEGLIEIQQFKGHPSKYLLTGNIPVQKVDGWVQKVDGGSPESGPVIGNQLEENLPPTPQRGAGRVVTLVNSREGTTPDSYTTNSNPKNKLRPPAGPPEVRGLFPRRSTRHRNGVRRGLAARSSSPPPKSDPSHLF